MSASSDLSPVGAGEAAPSSRRISWDVVRVVAVFFVILGHVTSSGPRIHPELGEYFPRSNLPFGAAGLMVVSAYFVCVTIRRARPTRWLWHRCARLLPTFVVAVLLTYGLTRYAVAGFNGLTFPGGFLGTMFADPISVDGPAEGVRPWYLPTPLDLGTNLAMIVPWSADFHWVDPSYWTMPIQVLAFAAAAMLFPRRLVRGARIFWLLWAMIVIPLLLPVAMHPFDTVREWVAPAVSGLGLSYARLFAVGVAIWLWSNGRMGTRHLVALTLVVTTAQFVSSPDLSEINLPVMLAFGVFVLLVAKAASGPDWMFPVFVRFRAQLRWLAGITFGVYLVQQQLGYVLARLLADLGVGPWPRLVVIFGAAVVAGWLLTVVVERPAGRLLTRRIRHRQAPAR
ncbi:acyltransferase family protein [Tamaricihabitans halophyticus]|uniref:acyltransferase family protein n=1 Tax=Tamaricihabitans halophyticus TaxID=1262583 RepID=UPI001404998D|nr:acyltransferase family protein [Tamaricihabitans halophyticus]